MKCAIVITLVLAILYCSVNVGDAMNRYKISGINRKWNTVTEDIVDVRKILSTTMTYLNKAKMSETENTMDIYENASKEIEMLVDIPADPADLSRCIETARIELEMEVHDYLQYDYMKYKIGKKSKTIVEKYNTIVTEGEALLEIYRQKSINPNHRYEGLKKDEQTFHDKVRYLKQNPQSKREIFESKFSSWLESSRQDLIKKIELIKEEAKKCIDEA